MDTPSFELSNVDRLHKTLETALVNVHVPFTAIELMAACHFLIENYRLHCAELEQEAQSVPKSHLKVN